MAKRKREAAATPAEHASSPSPAPQAPPPVHLQIVTGSYERVLHGITATISREAFQPSTSDPAPVQFADSFLFNAHASAIRCLALSPAAADSSKPQNVILASGGTDERINLYTLSASTTGTDTRLPSVPTLAGATILENPRNRELGSLLHHSSSITALHFPTRSKLLAAAEDNTISVTRIRDLSVVSTIKAPRPKAVGRPSGDTAPVGAAPAGVNDFAVHPSMKLMLSVGKGEKCMRLWNLVTGKKAGVLNFGRDVLEMVKEGKWSSGEGRKIVWNSAGEEFAISFDRGAIVFGIDSVPKCYILPSPQSKIHQIRYVLVGNLGYGAPNEVLAISTEDGRVIFYSTDTPIVDQTSSKSSVPPAQLWRELGSKSNDQPSRIKDFEFLTVDGHSQAFVVTAGSDGVVKVWAMEQNSVTSQKGSKKKQQKAQLVDNSAPRNIGRLLGAYETGNRITCLKAFVMAATETDQIDDEFSGLSSDEQADSTSSGDDSGS
ncbi:Protein mak11 [Ophidiomyces ophidiicola]|uniref:Protein mak11 n=1 Tax=Ophidiomyces ophidiicola TaxID=1387563 RepID=UPI0020C48C73|nr:Protein mak11 [Ophidiomyces ophidiicola]KAI1950892.1 Protein mak11 [Ophidiomyces ophidiicola]KAI2047615.1 Protein mak11 [Ophidiomyces ophidiicola]